ncbi:uncharacterized protein LOC113321480 isoform X2 [Papaver somniferum]|uniref:uncharacterized protein LOC113321480 isoform X2 n=1 Tax=Papaver somniferum TaxID=3469 RepID=UPI000E6FF25C|nr:uncharacterized protein LOC113321480 isoform X2 [Papaver somniferum]
MSAKELGDNRPNEEMTEIKELLNVLVQSQSKLAESLGEAQIQQLKSQESIQNQILEQAKSQENIQNQMLEALWSIKSTGNKHQGDSDVDSTAAHDDDGDNEEQSSEVEQISRATYNPDIGRDLYNRVMEGDCENTIEFFKNNPEALKQAVTNDSYTVLHVAIYERRDMILITEFVKLMSPELLECRGGEDDCTALHLAAQYGNLEAVVLLVNKNPRLPLLRNNRGLPPLDMAIQIVSVDQKEIVKYLYSVTKDVDPGAHGAYTLCALIGFNFYEIALSLVTKFPKVVMTKAKTDVIDMCGLEMMVRRPFAFKSGAKLTWWQDLIYSSIQVNMNSTCTRPVGLAGYTIRDEENALPDNLNYTKADGSSKVSSSDIYKGIIMSYLTRANVVKRLYNQKLVHQQATALIKQMLVEISRSTTLLQFLNDNPNIMNMAIKHGIIEFIAECLELNANLNFDWISGETMIKRAIIERNEMIVNLIFKFGDKLGLKIYLAAGLDKDQNTLLHYAAKLAPLSKLSLVSGAALQMQREMQWFKGVESVLWESHRYERNKTGETAQLIFTAEHKDLVKEGRDWLKDTSGSCMIVGALIATVSFAAAFTVPGGNFSDSNNPMEGTPIFLGKSAFTVFAVSDALAFFSSITSVLMFLAIYTSRFAEIDFLKSLPQNLILGLATLFISMAALLVGFGASLFIVVGSRFAQALIPITLFSCCPLGFFAMMQIPLFVEMVHSTYWGSLFREHRYIDLSSMKNDNKSRKKKKEN